MWTSEMIGTRRLFQGMLAVSRCLSLNIIIGRQWGRGFKLRSSQTLHMDVLKNAIIVT